ncbi:hypothetical protein P5V15_012879 [Pogonomyrmex californicus]
MIAGNKSKISCQNCNNFGHTAKDCRFKLTQKSDSFPYCRYCKAQGHLLENCELRNRRKANNSENSNGPSKSSVQRKAEHVSHIDIFNTPIKNIPNAQLVVVNLDKHSRVPTVRITLDKIISPLTFMLDTGSGPKYNQRRFCT